MSLASRQPSLNALRVFESVARLRSIADAAQQLHVTASAISHQIRRLEDKIGIALFARTSQPLSLTLEGESYFREVTSAFELLRSATARLLGTGDKRAVTITAIPVFAIKWLVPRLADFHRKHPEIEVRVSTSYRLVDLNHGDVDLAIRWGNGDWPHGRSIKLLNDTVQPVCSPRLLGKKRLRNPKDVHQYPLIHMTFARDDWAQWSLANGLTAPPASKTARFNDPSGAIQAAIDGLGFVLGPMTMVYEDIANGRLIAPLQTPVLLNEAYYLTQPERSRPNSSVAIFRDWLMEAAEAFSGAQPSSKLVAGPVDVSREQFGD